MPNPDENAETPPFRGIFIANGSRFVVPRLTLSISADGIVSSDLDLRVSLDLWTYWLSIGRRHANDAVAHHVDVFAAWEEEVEGERRGTAMEREFESAMQAIVAAGVAIDAFYASVKEYLTLPPELTSKWRANGTGRYKQVSEVFRRAFALTPRNAVKLRSAIKEIFQYRNWAVHPPAAARAPVTYDELRIGTEWRFVAFRADNARGLVGRAIAIIAQLVDIPRELSPEFVRYCGEARARVLPILSEWERDNGTLFDRRAGSHYVGGGES
jgi:hypothetical protein